MASINLIEIGDSLQICACRGCLDLASAMGGISLVVDGRLIIIRGMWGHVMGPNTLHSNLHISCEFIFIIYLSI